MKKIALVEYNRAENKRLVTINGQTREFDLDKLSLEYRYVVPCLKYTAWAPVEILDRCPTAKVSWVLGAKGVPRESDTLYTAIVAKQPPYALVSIASRELAACRVAWGFQTAALTPSSSNLALLDAVMSAHPMWRFKELLYGADLFAYANILVNLMDPRRFAHPLRPGRLSRLYQYCKVNRAGVREALTTPNAKDLSTLILSCIYNRPALAALAREQPSAPELFFWNIIEGGPEDQRAKRVLVAGKRFLTMLYYLWITALSAHPEMEFDVRSFFSDENAARWAEPLILGKV